MKRIAQIEKGSMQSKIPAFKAGDMIKVHVKIKEGDKERVQVFQGTVISRRGTGTGETFTVRKISSGIGVERIFPLHSPNISKIQRTRIGKVRRAKLYYLRGLTGKSARIEEKLDDKRGNEVNRKEIVDEKARGKKIRESAKEPTKTESKNAAKSEKDIAEKNTDADE
jgi:large subunit ribosomal protein L19